MTLQRYDEWKRTTLQDCLADGTCRPYDQSTAWCKYYSTCIRACGYITCPRRCYYKTEGMCTVSRTDDKTTLTFWDDMIKISLTPERVAFLAHALREISDSLKEV